MPYPECPHEICPQKDACITSGGCLALFPPKEPTDPEPEAISKDGTIRKLHYGKGKQPWDVWGEWGLQFEGAILNIHRYMKRDSSVKGVERDLDIKKAKWYIDRLHELMPTNPNTPEGRRQITLYQNLRMELTPEERLECGLDGVNLNV